MKLFDTLLSLVAPHDCMGCTSEGRLVCADCRPTLGRAEPRCYNCHNTAFGFRTCATCRATSPLGTVYAAYKYDDIAKDLVWKLKSGRTSSAGVEIAELIASSLPGLRRQNIIITHAPTASSRVRRRGYDQAALIARALAVEYGVLYCPLLRRSGQTQQVGATKSGRAEQLAAAFRAIHADKIRGAHIILVDDVVTTGSTLEAAARVLRAAGARRVDGVAFAQA